MKKDEEEQQRDAESIARGERAAAFLRSDFWLRDLEPLLASEQQKARDHCLWSPATGLSLDEMGLRNAFYSGASASIERTVVSINDFVVRGEEAREMLRRSEEK